MCEYRGQAEVNFKLFKPLMAMLLATAGLVGTTYGQIVTAASKPVAEQVQPAKAEPSATEANPADAKAGEDAADEKPAEESLLQAAEKFKFDRLPASILEAWKLEGSRDADEATEEGSDVQRELKALLRNVTLSQWAEVADYLKSLPDETGSRVYQVMLTSLAGSQNKGTPQPGMGDPAMKKYAVTNVFTADDVLGLIAACPGSFDKETTTKFAPILELSLEQGHAVETFATRFSKQLESDSSFPLNQREVARLLVLAGYPANAGPFLPTLDEAIAEDDHDVLLLLTEHFLAAKEAGASKDQNEQAWKSLQAILSLDDLPEGVEMEAVTRCLDLVPSMPEDQGKAWLRESFQEKSQRGIMILSSLGSQVSQGLPRYARDVPQRLKYLRLQSQAVDALVTTLEAEPEAKRSRWMPMVSLLAENWMREAEITLDLAQGGNINSQLRRDPYGNTYFINANQMMQQNGPVQPIALSEMIQLAPKPSWEAMIVPSLKPEFITMMTKLYLKAGEEIKAFPYIEQLATLMPDRAHQQAEAFMKTWITNHDLNSQNRANAGQVFMAYGYQPRSASIPLTRSQQERNLSELSDWLDRLKALPIDPIDEGILLEAFMKCHSTAEVYRLEAIESVLGDVATLDDTTLGKIAQTMRTNLATVWKDPNVQQRFKTNRKMEDLQAEILRGYQVAYQLIERGLAAHPQSWALKLAYAALLHDENAYLNEIDAHHNFEEQRQKAFTAFREAAEWYCQQVPQLSKDDYSPEVYQLWFLAALGACDVGNIDESNRLAPSQPPRIIAAIEQLPPPAREYHQEQFANGLFQTLSGVSPNAKYRYLKTGLEVAGDHPLTNEAQKVFSFYKDLVTEIQLDVAIDGSDVVGHETPFGVYVNIRHTAEIERESGGFGKYLQNQNSMAFAYNYGRPKENYRDKFEAAVRAALEEQFDVLSVTFQGQGTQSKSLNQYGWRVTPYAFLLLQAKGPQVDTIPSFSLDMDFVDTSGYVVLPIESAIIPLDASPTKGDPRPYDQVKLVQTLDERELDQQKLALEIKATGNGVLPEVDQLIEMNFPGFEITELKFTPVSVTNFDSASSDVIVTERACNVSLQAVDTQAPITTFQFANPQEKAAIEELVYQRFDDADILTVGATIPLAEPVYHFRYRPWIVGGMIFVVCLAGGLAYLYLAPKAEVRAEAERIQMPPEITPFSAINFLRHLKQETDFSEQDRSELQGTIDSIERMYFRQGETQSIDLEEILQSWMEKSRSIA